MIFLNKYKYRLERSYELICYMILNYYPIDERDRYRVEGLEQARRVLEELMGSKSVEDIAKRIITERAIERSDTKNKP